MPEKSSDMLDNKSRERIAEFLPDALVTALESYYGFAKTEIPDTAKGFSDHHNACKVAIAHIDLLLKLAKWAHLPDDGVVDDESQRRLVNILENAQAEYNAFQSKNDRHG